jgi:topoisomerase-4 subunit B
MAKRKKTSYLADDIEVLSGLEPVRRRPGMYTDTSCPNHLAHEVIDNSVDEAIAGFANEINVTLHRDGSLSVLDNGRGMPVDQHPEEKLPGIELILTRLHAGAKFSQKTYQFSGGLHGVGISVVNALSAKMVVNTKRDGKVYNIVFKNGVTHSRLTVVRTIGKMNTGTQVHFWPNAQYFDSVNFSIASLENILRSKAVLCPGLKVTFDHKALGEHKEWRYEGGLKDYLLEQLEGFERFPEDVFAGHFENSETVDFAIAWVFDEKTNIRQSFANLIPTLQSGTHVNGLRQGLIEAMREFCDLHGLLPRGVKLAPDDIWETCCFILSVKLSDAQFAGQTKEKLTSRSCYVFVSNLIKDAFSLWLNNHMHDAKFLSEQVIARAQNRLGKAQKVTRKKITSGPALPGKLADCIEQDRRVCELFLVEGDSAGGSAKQGRDKNFQAVLPLRGKILNTWEVASERILASKEIHDIAAALGIDPNTDHLTNLRYDKVCVLADADSDGAHIAALICALFLKHFKALLVSGHVYIAMPPLYRIDVGKQKFYALDDDEKKGILDHIVAEKKPGTVHIQRFKGLGEMNPGELRETTMNPDTRRLVRLTIHNEKETMEVVDLLLAKKRSGDRRAWLEKKGDLAEVL